jgi:hypothetical protein
MIHLSQSPLRAMSTMAPQPITIATLAQELA